MKFANMKVKCKCVVKFCRRKRKKKKKLMDMLFY